MTNNTTAPALTDEQLTIQWAIESIEASAKSLQECHTQNGTWGDDTEAQSMFEREMEIASALRALLTCWWDGLQKGAAFVNCTPRGVYGAMLDAAPAAPATPVAEAKPYFSGVSELIIRDVCEMEPANPDLNDTICIDVSDLQAIVKRHTEVCATCNGHGMIGGPSFYAPDEGGVPCPDCAQAVAADGEPLVRNLSPLERVEEDIVVMTRMSNDTKRLPMEETESLARLLYYIDDLRRAAVSPATAEPREAGHGINGIPRAAFGPHTEADRIDHCGSCGAENDPQKDDVCPVCHAECSLVSTWGEFQHTRYRNGQRYANNGPQPWEDGPQPATAEACAHDYVRSDRVCTECGEQAPTAALPIKIPHVHIRPEDEEIGRQYYALGFVDGSRSITDAPQPATADEQRAAFEAEVSEKSGLSCACDVRGRYIDPTVRGMWEARQAERASQAAAPQANAAEESEDAYVIRRLSETLADVCVTLRGEDPVHPDDPLNKIELVKRLAEVLRMEVELYRAQAAAPAEAREPVAYTSRARLQKLASNPEHVETMWGVGLISKTGNVALYDSPASAPADAGEAVAWICSGSNDFAPIVRDRAAALRLSQEYGDGKIVALGIMPDVVSQGAQGRKGGDRADQA